MTYKELLEFITAQAGKLIQDTEVLEQSQKCIENIVIKIKNEHGMKLSALFNGHKQHSDQFDRIEKEVAKHDEFIISMI